MSEIDPLILELKAKVDQFERDLERTTRRVEDQLGRQQREARKLEEQFRRSSGAISASLKGLAATIAAAFSGQQIVGFIDSYTRLQNSLRVAGLEGENLAQVQAKLFDLAAKNGTSANALADLYGKAASAAGELGASQSELINLTESTALALRVSGVSAEQASGAILGLTQALAGGTVRAEEYNQIVEGGLRPLLQAAVANGQFGGSVAKLRNEVTAGTVSSQAFFDAILEGSGTLRDQAANATLTLSGAVESLNARLIEYVGSNASASGATGLLSGAIQSLADNIEEVIEALALIAAVMGVRYVAALGAAALASNTLLVRTFSMVGAMGALTVASRQAGAALASAFTGPLGVAIGAVAVGMALVSTNSETASARTQKLDANIQQASETLNLYQQRLRDAGVQVDATGKGADVASEKVAGFAGQLLNAASAALQLANNLKVADLARIGSRLQEIDKERLLIESSEARSGTARGSRAGIGRSGIESFSPGVSQSTREANARDLRKLEQERQILLGQMRAIREGVAAGVDVTQDKPARSAASPATAAPRVSRSTGTASTRQGPDPAEVERRFLDELANIQSRIISANASRATSIEAQANAEREQLRLSEESALRSLAADKDLTDAQRAQLFLRLSELANAEREAINFRERADIEQRNRDLADERGRALIDGLRAQFDLATTEKDRRRIALQILDAEQAILRERLQQQIDNTTLSDAVREQASIALKALDAQAAAQVEATKRQFASPLERFADRAKDSDTAIEEAVVRRVQDINRTITDSFTNALGIKDPFLSELISIFLDKNIFGPLADALSKGGGNGIVSTVGQALPGILKGLGGLFGRASGGRVNAGQIYRINEGASPGRVEAFRPDVSGQIIPLGRMNAVSQGGGAPASGTVRLVIEEAPGFASRVQAEATGVAIEVVRQSAPTIVDAAANETFRRANRPGL